MKEIERYSPVSFKATPLRHEKRDNWNVVLEYKEEKEGPFLVDLCHRTRLDFQDSDLTANAPSGITVPEKFGQSVFADGFLVNRMNRTQVSIWHLAGDKPEMSEAVGVTDVTEATVFLALIGDKAFEICEKLSALDFQDPQKETPFLLQGPFSHVPCQITTLCRDGEKSGVLLTCSRGYAEDMVHAVMEAGEEFSLRPAGEERFTAWLSSL